MADKKKGNAQTEKKRWQSTGGAMKPIDFSKVDMSKVHLVKPVKKAK